MHLSAARQAFLTAGITVLVFAAVLYFTTGSVHPTFGNSVADLPSQLSNTEFWSMVTDFSEPDGYFRSDNFLSNEAGFQEVIPALKRTIMPGGVYLGVGPEQNFTYIAALKPRIAFIIDIRRQNMIEHLLYKAFIELAADRADFVSKLFARPRPAGLGSGSTAETLFNAYGAANPNGNLFEKNLSMAIDRLAAKGIPLSVDDQASMRKVYNAFFESGPDLSYTFIGNERSASRGMPSYTDLMTATDDDGKNWGYLATENQFEIVQQLERNNLIVPVVGNFAGDKTIRTIGKYVADHHASVTTFYLSNVEQYLFQQNDDWSRFYANVGTLPIDSTSTFIRSTADRRALFRGRGRWPLRMLTASIAEHVQAFNAGQIHAYYDVVGRTNTVN